MTKLLQNRELSNHSQFDHSTLLQEVLELIKKNQSCSMDQINSFEWAVSGFIDFLKNNRVEPSISNINVRLSTRWLDSLENEEQHQGTIIMKIMVITSFFTHLNHLGMISFNPFLECYKHINHSINHL
ncbi:hypothetical protein ACQKP0_14830 [Heyndrickxia sp. NPDC080065]|uniref:hypothetical protein n=1 Tax=Heyndrickxia sp. NPDC080065 TaxID=3390568 RepID=UPI003CFCEBBA